MRYYDLKKNSLVYVGVAATCGFWDSLWKEKDAKKVIFSAKKKNFVCRATAKYLKLGTKLIEGGCGMAKNVYLLGKMGYDVVGVDFAHETVEFLNKNFPDIKVISGDIRKLPFAADEFDGYWSIGVIEHFIDGYQDVLKEMSRVIKSGGYLFLTFPHMSKIRRLKAKLGLFEKTNWDKIKSGDFYQFALDEKKVIRNFEQQGFVCVETKYLDGVKGLKDEVSLLKKPLQNLYDSGNIFAKGTKFILDILVSWFSSHSILIVLKKR